MSFHAVRGLGQLAPIPMFREEQQRQMSQAYAAARQTDQADVSNGDYDNGDLPEKQSIWQEPLLWVGLAAGGLALVLLLKKKG